MCLISSILSPIAFRAYFHFNRRRTTLTQLNAFVVELLQCVTCQAMLQRVDAKDDFRIFLRNYPCQFSHRGRIVAISALGPDSYQSIPNLSIVFQRYRPRQAEPLIMKHSHVSVALVLASLGTQDVLAGQGFPSKQSPSKDRRLSAPCGLHRFWGNHIDDNSTPIYRRECPRTQVSSLEVSTG